MLQPALSALLLNILAIASLFVVLITIYNRVFQITTRLSKPRRICSEPQPFLTKAAVLFSRSGPYTFTYDWPRPQISSREILIRTHAVGLNPIDWKSVSYGFGLHSIPWVSGREAAGTIEEVGEDVQGFCKGDRVAVISTNYRDVRMATFQEVITTPWKMKRSLGRPFASVYVDADKSLLTSMLLRSRIQCVESLVQCRLRRVRRWV